MLMLILILFIVINDASVNTTCLDDEARIEFGRCSVNIVQEMAESDSDAAFNALRAYYER